MQDNKIDDSKNKMPVAGVIGDPIAHSLSPALHNHWLKKMGLAGHYESRAIATEDCKSFFDDLRSGQAGWVGCNITLPHKTIALQNCDVATAAAEKIGAVNMMVVKNGKLHGDNSDWIGFKKNLQSWQNFCDAKKNRAVVIGAGGAARGVVYGLQQLGFGDIVVVNRTIQKLADIKKDFGVMTDSLAAMKNHLATADIVVNATSLGLQGEALPFDMQDLPRKILLHDIIYGLSPTPFLAMGKELGFAVRDGLDMLIHQAVPGFQAWFNAEQTPPIDDELRDYLLSQKK